MAFRKQGVGSIFILYKHGHVYANKKRWFLQPIAIIYGDIIRCHGRCLGDAGTDTAYFTSKQR